MNITRMNFNMAKMVACVALLLACVAVIARATPLDDYVNMPDSHYKYEVLDEYRMDGQYIAYVLNMTSQKWLTCKFPWYYLHIVFLFLLNQQFQIKICIQNCNRFFMECLNYVKVLVFKVMLIL